MTRRAPEAASVVLPPLPDGWQVVTYVALADGTLAIVGTDVDLRHEWRRDEDGRPIGQPSRVAGTADARLWTFDGSVLAEGPAFPLLTGHPMIDRFSDGRWMVASPRTDDEPNGRILGTDGNELRRIRLGDGIEHLKIDDADRIWVGWFDEGIAGNEYWSVSGLEWPPSSYGVAAFDEYSTVVAHATTSGLSRIMDCEALNVTGGTAWAFGDFPILSIDVDTPQQQWPMTLDGPKVLAIRAPFIVVAGGYERDGDRVVLVRLERDRAEIVDSWRLPFSLRVTGDADFADGRGDRLHVVHDGVWHRWRVEDFVADSRG